VTDFRAETVAIDVKGRIKLRRLFQDANIPCKADEEPAAAEKFLVALDELAAQAGGEPPLPACPKTTTLDGIRALSGNEMLAAMLKEHDELKKLLEAWQQRATLAQNRLPAWRTLEKLLEHAHSIPEAASLQAEADAVCNERRLLDSSDPVPPIQQKVVALLRAALKKTRAATKEIFGREMKALEASANWQKVAAPEQTRLLNTAGLKPPAELSIGDDAGLTAELSARSLAVWASRADALPERFRQVTLAAAKLLEPQTQSVKLRSGTLKTPEDVKAWLVETETELLDKIQEGPVVIG